MNPELVQHTEEGGYFRIFITPPGGRRKDITFFRDLPTKIGSFSSTDPFGDATASVLVPGVTTFDKPGQGDLDWLIAWSNLDIRYYHSDGSTDPWSWEGLLINDGEPGADGTVLTAKGALYQADNYQAAPWFPQYPIPYELLIKMALDPSSRPSLRTAPLKIEFPADWNTKVPEFQIDPALWFLRPYGVKTGDKWTGLTTRNTGGWEPVLTGFVQTLLSVMYTEESQWTIYKKTGRIPVLKVRPTLSAPNDDTYEVYNGTPGTEITLNRDFTQSANVVYAQGTDLAGSSYSGQVVSTDGQRTHYEPFAALPYVHPAEATNPLLNRHMVRKETRLQLPPGMDMSDAADTAAAHLRRFADPGYTGSITLSADPLVGTQPRSRYLIHAGEQIVVRNWRGSDLLLHITETTASPEEGTITLTVDSKFRDALTVAEVRARTRDALDPVRLLQVGKYSTTVQDLILPWSYSEGSGVIPSGGDHDATEFFTKRLGAKSRFPWTDFTTKYPPRKFPKYYIRATAHSSNADKNWANLSSDGIARGFPIRMSQSGQIRLIQIAAYDIDGNVVPCRFHLSIYNNSGVTSRDMPRIPNLEVPGRKNYLQGQAYPFFAGAFERLNPDGTETTDPLRTLHDSAGLVIGWGNYYEEAGYWPGRYSTGGNKTGMLTDESVWAFDTTMDPDFDKYSVENTRNATTTGRLYGMIYVDYHGGNAVYFMGRCWRQESVG